MISKRTIYTFYDLLTNHGTLTIIRGLFESECICEVKNHVTTFNGQRRSRADSYVSSLDLNSRED